MVLMSGLLATAFSCPHSFGLLAAEDGSRPESPLTVERWMDIAAECGLQGVEIPVRGEGSTPEDLIRLRDAAHARKLVIVLAGGQVFQPGRGGSDLSDLRHLIRAACVVSEPRVVRTTLSGILCGDRRKLDGGWDAHCANVLGALKEIVPKARDSGIAIALENHQDATSADLIRLCEEAGPEVVGVCLDTGNPLAVSEDPVEFTRRVAPYVRHVHLKDYRIHFAPNGFRLTRCAAGDGVVDFPGILDALEACPHPLTPGVEVGAQSARLIPILDEGWWSGFEPRPTTDALAPLRILWERGIPADAEWRTPWERGETSKTIVEDEMETFRRSAEYLKSLSPAPRRADADEVVG